MTTQMSPSRLEGFEELFNRTQPARLTFMVDRNVVRGFMNYFRQYDDPHAKEAEYESLIEWVYTCFEQANVLNQKESGYTYNCAVLDILSKLMNNIVRIAMISFYYPQQYDDIKAEIQTMIDNSRKEIMERITIKVDYKFSN